MASSGSSTPADSQIRPDDTLAIIGLTRRHEKYYWEDGNVVFLVEQVLFRVHRYLFEQSEVFRAMFSLPPPTGQVVEGSSDDDPVRIGGLSAVAFEQLLWYMYPGFHGDVTAISADGWVQILDVATMFDFERIRSNAISVLQRCPDPIFRLTIAERYHIDDWRTWCYVELCTRPAYLSPAEIQTLGRETADQLLRARELVRSHLFRRAHGQGTPWSCPESKGSKKNGCAERVATTMCEVLLKSTDNTQTLVPHLYAVLGPKADGQLRENGLCGFCVLQWEKDIWNWLGMSDIKKILKGVFRNGIGKSREGSPICELQAATLQRQSDRELILDAS